MGQICKFTPAEFAFTGFSCASFLFVPREQAAPASSCLWDHQLRSIGSLLSLVISKCLIFQHGPSLEGSKALLGEQGPETQPCPSVLQILSQHKCSGTCMTLLLSKPADLQAVKKVVLLFFFLCWCLHVKHQGAVLHSCPEVWPCFCCFLTVVRALHFFSLRWVAQAPITMETWFVFPNSFSWTQHLSAWEKEGCKLQVSCAHLWGC